MRGLYIRNSKSRILFLVQYASIFFIIFTGPLLPGNAFLLGSYILGFIIGIWSIVSMGPGNLNASADVLPSSRLTTSGPYRIIRHPMYTAVILVMSSLLINYFTSLRFLVYLLGLLSLFLKIAYEEHQLQKHHAGYASYKLKTWRMIPYIF